MMRTFVDSETIPKSPLEFQRYLDFNTRTTFCYRNGKWKKFKINKTCMRDLEVAVFDEARIKLI